MQAQASGQGPTYRVGLFSGEVQTSHALPPYNPGVPALHLVYNSTAANAQPVFVVHYQIDPSQAIPSTVSAQLTFNGVGGQVYYYSLSGTPFNPGDMIQMALQGNATSLTTGRYSYSISVVANYASPVTTTYSGSVDVINSASSPFGTGWTLDNVQRIWSVTGGVILELPGGTSLWFANGQSSGTFVTPAGDFSTLTQNTSTLLYTRTLKDGRKINFNSSGYQTSIVDTNNNTTTFSYNGSNQLTKITDFVNQVTTFSYTGSNVASITDTANRTTSLTYTGSQLTGVQDPDGDQWSYGYDSSNDLTTITNPRSNTSTITYNFAGRATTVNRADGTSESFGAVELKGLVQAGQGTQSSPATPWLAATAWGGYSDPRGNFSDERLDWLGFGQATQSVDPLVDMTITYRDANGLPWLVSDPLARRTRNFFDSSGNFTKAVLPDDNTQQYTYNGFSERLTYTDPTNYITSYGYDANGNLTKITDALNDVTTMTYNAQGFLLTQTDALNHTTSYGYDSRDRTITRTDAAGHVLTMGYDAASNMNTSTDERGYTTSFTYDADGKMLTKQLPDANPANHPTYTYTYDGSHNLTSVTDPLGNTITTTFDKLDRRIAVTDALNHTTSYSFDGDNNVVTVQDAVGRVITSSYDIANRTIAQTDGLGHTWTYTYDVAGEQVTVQTPLSQVTTTTYNSRGAANSITNALGSPTTYSYNANMDPTQTSSGKNTGHGNGPSTTQNWNYTTDALHRRTSATDPLGNTTTYAYDAVSNLIATQDALSHTVTQGYDADNRLITTRDAANDVTSFGYDFASNRITVTDPNGRVTSYAYDAQNRLISVTDPRGAITSYAYDLAGRNISITDPVGNITSYSYDQANRLTATTDALGQATYAYDAANERTGMTDRDGRQRTSSFDNAGRQTTEKWINGQGATIYTATFVYDNANRMTSETDGYSNYSLTYDAIGEVTVVDNANTPSAPHLVLTYTYDAWRMRTNTTDNFGGSITYTYDDNNKLTQASMVVNSTQGPQFTVAYDAANRVTGVTRTIDGTQTITSSDGYDNANRLTTLTYSSSVAGALATYVYSYDPASQLTQYTGPEGTLTYTYDLAGELTGVGNARNESYGYDLNGNRNTTGYTTATGNRLTGDGTFTYAYDSEGNLTSKTRLSDNELWTYTWDYRNRLTQVVEKTSLGATVTNDQFTYDVDNRRIGKSTNGTQTWFAYDGQNTFADFNSGGSLTNRYLYGNAIDQLFAKYASGTSTWYLTDKLGSVRQLTNTSGTVLDTLTYDSFGNILTETNSGNGDRFKFTAREWDSEITLQFNRARYYSSASGRWATEDPLAFSGGDANLYRYVHNAPVVQSDSTGLSFVPRQAKLEDPCQKYLDCYVNNGDNQARVLYLFCRGFGNSPSEGCMRACLASLYQCGESSWQDFKDHVYCAALCASVYNYPWHAPIPFYQR
jgi:RHS repeat-associated protein